jgi:hypothetical protein
MRDIDLAKLLAGLVLRFKREKKSPSAPVFLTIPQNLPVISWSDNPLEMLIFALLENAISASSPESPVRLGITQTMAKSDLEELLEIHPSYWIQMRIDMQCQSGIGADIQEEIRFLGFRHADEWSTENSSRRLISYGYTDQPAPQILLWMQDSKASHKYTLLIPINQTAD